MNNLINQHRFCLSLNHLPESRCQTLYKRVYEPTDWCLKGKSCWPVIKGNTPQLLSSMSLKYLPALDAEGQQGLRQVPYFQIKAAADRYCFCNAVCLSNQRSSQCCIRQQQNSKTKRRKNTASGERVDKKKNGQQGNEQQTKQRQWKRKMIEKKPKSSDCT